VFSFILLVVLQAQAKAKPLVTQSLLDQQTSPLLEDAID